ncbi:PfkB family carbohydrate kinase [Streptomyces justiciae]|uniref:PfkB family carbohydrate kinase n=1 Tax=Streptomyces justiciae TaxID=2780140 RepID=UPI001881D3C3|nr:PfkB family carbohydrate kinase [Streptomyces justiciae]MBE8474477.1 5-dehydro-2-deoxygluconokinase [Streptomyces justiciae]
MAGSAQPFDLITIGRTGVDLHPQQSGVPSSDVQTFGKFLGGSAANVAVAAARLGRSAAAITVTPTFRADEVDYFALRSARILWITGAGLSEEPCRSVTLAALKSRERTGMTVFDLDWRPKLWGDPEDARPYYTEALRHATVAIGNLDECEIATGVREPRACVEALLAAGVELAVVKQGPKGVLAMHRDGRSAEVAPLTVEVVNGHGASDAFGGSLCHGLLSGWELDRVMRYANAAGALVASRLACSAAVPTREEIEGLLSGAPS